MRPMCDKIRRKCLQYVRPAKVCIDEKITSFEGHIAMRQHGKGKSNSVAIKKSVLTSTNGFLLDFLLYEEKDKEIKLNKVTMPEKLDIDGRASDPPEQSHAKHAAPSSPIAPTAPSQSCPVYGLHSFSTHVRSTSMVRTLLHIIEKEDPIPTEHRPMDDRESETGATTTWIRRSRTPDENTLEHEAIVSPPSRTCDLNRSRMTHERTTSE
ncbi:hypothetical protein EVAR_25191_1 [Eumeta japonica]|uniref:PiggyBac transposable element-derived protein domain-containing protein n=1 Tax=Eumeta variegata TaxID=151549 RepID=A0A4C1WK41_EUMVA|nr:hypothetical protein EVAR_25191_1 [Eumeta japonica]